jgi:hypothetical protein
VGMFARRGGWGTGLPMHPLTVTVGGLARKPGLVGDQVVPREFLSLTLEIDHDVVDGAPAARFTERFCRLLESGANLPSEELPATQLADPEEAEGSVDVAHRESPGAAPAAG